MLLDVRPDHLKIVQEILQRHVPQHPVWAFGSRAKWTAKDYSDLDLCVVSEQPLDFRVLGALAEEFSESDLPWKVDVVDWATTSEGFRKIIERDKVVVQKAKPVGRVSLQGVTRQAPVANADVGLRYANPTYATDWGADSTIGQLISDNGGSVKTGPFGTALKASEYVSDGVPLISVREIGHGSFHIDKKTPRVSPETTSRLSEYLLESGDIVFARKGGIERCSLVRKAQVGWFLGSDGIRLRPPKNCDARFLAYSLQTQSVKDWLTQHSTGSTMASLNQATIARIPICIPSIDEQSKVADCLETLDDRITILRETNASLEAIAQALFKSWFVDFDPVHAKQQGRAPEGMDEATAELFPDGFEESELGLVPGGWRVGSVCDVAEVIKGKSYSSKDLAESHDTALVSLKSFERGGGFRLDGFKPYTGSYKPSQVVVPGDLIVAYTDVTQAAELIGKPAIVVGVAEYKTLVASLDVGVIRPDTKQTNRQFLYGLFRTDAFQSHTFSHTSGTTVLHLAKDGVGSFRFARAPIEIVNAFAEIAESIVDRRQINIDQMRTLATLRDTLLPRLISGQLRLPEAEAMLEDATA